MGSYDSFIDKQPTLIKKGGLVNTSVIWGSIAQEFDTYRTNAKECSSVPVTADNVTGELLDELVKRLTGYIRNLEMTDDVLLDYIDVFFRKNGNGSWATKWAIIDAFSYLLEKNSLFLVENWVSTNLMAGNNFEDFDVGVQTAQFGQWIPSGTSINILDENMFEGTRCMSVSGTGSVYQDITSAAGTYILLVPYTGNGKIIIQRTSDSYYWNFSTMAWNSISSYKAVSNSTSYYKIQELFVIFSSDDTARITFEPETSSDTFIVDYLRYGLKVAYPYIELIYRVDGQGGNYLNNWPSGDDPISGLDESNATFLDSDFISGTGTGYPSNFYQKILDDIKPAGVKAVFEFVGEG
jgi:hypothetical protein